MKLLATALFIVSSQSAFAHLEVGKYSGSDRGGEPCEFRVESVAFEGNVKHPLNERVVIRYENRSYTLSHLPIVTISEFKVVPEAEVLTGTRGTENVNEAFILKMGHVNGQHGPQEFSFVKHYPEFQSMSNRYMCLELKRTGN